MMAARAIVMMGITFYNAKYLVQLLVMTALCSCLHRSQLDTLEQLAETLAILLAVLLKPVLELASDGSKLAGDRQLAVWSQRARVEKRIEQLVPQVDLPVLMSAGPKRNLVTHPFQWRIDLVSHAIVRLDCLGANVLAKQQAVTDTCETKVVSLIRPWSSFAHLDAVALIRFPV